ncbi:hypothetical protein HPQ64_16930 [Rhizobiales bacterium]|uniref:hypothetical protein n=1 Tax=Hongsoonwoonella zoysiae TaxID=2821844 RepID=UPI001560A835|nr:hypothetical protein [Hongsoonwoonella zoysiae]NRG19379.1 hypothetical protein [Hongsoonwoonella zoysiae]
MAERSVLVQKIRTYLEALSPRAVDMLVRNLEQSCAKGNEDKTVRLILDACLELLRSDKEAVSGEPRANWLQRLFFRPVEALLIDELLPHKQKGRINRSSLNGIWTLVERDLAPDAVSEAQAQVLREETGEAEAATIAGRLRDRVTPEIRKFLRDTTENPKFRRQMAMIVGGDRAFQDLTDLVEAFEAEAWLMPFFEALPERLSDWDCKGDGPTAKRVREVMKENAAQAALVASAVLSRTDNPASLATLACGLAGTNDEKLLADSAYSAFIDMVLSETERLHIMARKPSADAGAASAVSRYREVVRQLERDMEFASGGAWHKRLSETRRQFSDLVKSELDTAVSRVRRALEIPPLGGDGKPVVDRAAVEDAMRSLETLQMMRGAAESFAVVEVTMRTRQAVEQTLEIMTRRLLSDVAKVAEEERPVHIAAADVAIELCESYFGKDYADSLRRSRRIAANGGEVKSGPAAKPAIKKAGKAPAV